MQGLGESEESEVPEEPEEPEEGMRMAAKVTTTVPREEEQQLHMKIGGMSCSFCTESIKRAYARSPGVYEVHVNLAHEEALVRYNPEVTNEVALKDLLRDLGYTVRDPRKVQTFEDQEQELQRSLRLLLAAAGLTGTAMVALMADLMGVVLPDRAEILLVLALLTMVGPGWHILTMAWASLRRGILNQHVLLEFGAWGGLMGGTLGFITPGFPRADFYAVAVFITTYHLLSGHVSLLVRTRSSQAVRRLLALQPPVARVERDGRELEIPIDAVLVGDIVRIRPGEQIPVDGTVIDGSSAVNEALITGEPLPVDKKAGSTVIGGAINLTGTLRVAVEHLAQDSFLEKVARQIEEARALRPGVLQLVDQVLRVYVPAILIVAGAALLGHAAVGWAVTGRWDWASGLFAALAVLVMGYPCALGMATPLAMIRGGGMGAQRGILFRSGESFQVMREVDTVVLDKTGTVTSGEPAVAEIVPAAGTSQDDVLTWAAAVEAFSEHPVAQAVMTEASDHGLEPPDVEDFDSVPGRGARARADGADVLVGSPRFLQESGIEFDEGPLGRLQGAGQTTVGVARRSEFLGWISVKDTVRPEAAGLVARLKAAHLAVVMLTGDNQASAEVIAAQVGIETVWAETLPGEKADRVRALQAAGHRVLMAGDGINDAPALMQAEVGMAVGSGTDIAIEAADVVLVRADLNGIADAIEIGRSSYRKTVQNLTLAFAFNGIGVPLAALGLVPPVWAMAAMVLSVTTVLLNSFGGRLIRRRPQGGSGVQRSMLPAIEERSHA